MSYQKPDRILPRELLEQVQEYVDGALIYIPKTAGHKKCWGRGPPPGRSFVFAINRFTVIICPARVRTSCPPCTVCRLKAYRES